MTTERGAPILELRNVSTHYGLVAVLRDVDMDIYAGEMVCLLGGNASGKTTTLRRAEIPIVGGPLGHVYEGRATCRAILCGLNFKHGASGAVANATRVCIRPSTS